jgi:hypothetical protein
MPQQDRLRGAARASFRDEDFPVTIVRPSRTYGDADRARGQQLGQVYTAVDRMRQEKKVIVPGDGSSSGDHPQHRFRWDLWACSASAGYW